MKRILLRFALALAVAAPGLLAQPKQKSKAEYDALQAMYNAQTPDARIAACENVLTKFADTEFKALALYFEAASYDQKRDYEHTVVFGERTLEADPKYYQAMLLLARVTAQHIKEFDLDREEKLAQVEKYAKTALELLKDAPKPNATITDDQWTSAKKDFAAEAHAARGAGALAVKKYDVAETELKTALSVADRPDPLYFVELGMAYKGQGKYDEAIGLFEKVTAMPDANPQVKQYAQVQRDDAKKKREAKPAPPPAAAKPGDAAPPQAEPEKH